MQILRSEKCCPLYGICRYFLANEGSHCHEIYSVEQEVPHNEEKRRRGDKQWPWAMTGRVGEGRGAALKKTTHTLFLSAPLVPRRFSVCLSGPWK